MTTLRPEFSSQTVDTENATVEPYERPFEDAAIWASGVIIFSFLVFGIILNMITILVISKYKKLRNIFTYFICSLCISDLLSAMISPLFWYRRTLGFDLWALPNFFCKFYWAADIMTSFATAMHIVAFAWLRYISIKWPFIFRKITRNIGLLIITTIWIISLGCGFVPYYIFFGARYRDRYSDAEDARWPSCTINMEWYDQYTLFIKVGYSIFLYVPLILVVVISILISLEVRSSAMSRARSASTTSVKRKQKDKQAVFQLILIVISFLLGYIPFTAYEFWSTQPHAPTRYNKILDYHFGLIEYFFIRFSECLNPIFYNLGSSKMRKFTSHYLVSLCGRKPQERYPSISESRFSNRAEMQVVEE